MLSVSFFCYEKTYHPFDFLFYLHFYDGGPVGRQSLDY